MKIKVEIKSKNVNSEGRILPNRYNLDKIKFTLNGEEFKFVLRKVGLSFASFGKMVGKSEKTIHRLTKKKRIGPFYERDLIGIIGHKRLNMLHKEWVQIQNEITNANIKHENELLTEKEPS